MKLRKTRTPSAAEEPAVPAARYAEAVRFRNEETRRADRLHAELRAATNRNLSLSMQLEDKSEQLRQLSGTHVPAYEQQRTALAEKALTDHAERLSELTTANQHAYRRIAELEDECRALRASAAALPAAEPHQPFAEWLRVLSGHHDGEGN